MSCFLLYNDGMKKYLTGEFAKKAGVTERTLRFYDKKGLLKPSVNPDNNYRMYTDNDFIKLQNILILKQIGFSLEDIQILISRKDRKSLVDMLNTQKELVNQKLDYFRNLKQAIEVTEKSIEGRRIDWDKMMHLMHLLTGDGIIEHYKDSHQLTTRISLHQKYTVGEVDWYDWIYSQIKLTHTNRILEVGCGEGSLWKNRKISFRHREIFLSDKSEGMVESARKNLGNDFNFLCFPLENIPFKDHYFDVVIANHTLFYLHDMKSGLKEIVRVLDDKGVFYTTTYSKNHLKEITDMAKEFDNRITLSDEPLYEVFGMENGKRQLRKYFTDVEMHIYQDQLLVTSASDLYDYIMSCHGNQLSVIGNRSDEFISFLEDKLKDNGLLVNKEACLFICKNM